MIFLYKCLETQCLKGEHTFEYHHIPRNSKATCNRCSSQNVEKVFAPKVSVVVNGASAANNYGLKPTRRKK